MKQPAEMYGDFVNGKVTYSEFLEWVDLIKRDASTEGYHEGLNKGIVWALEQTQVQGD